MYIIMSFTDYSGSHDLVIIMCIIISFTDYSGSHGLVIIMYIIMSFTDYSSSHGLVIIMCIIISFTDYGSSHGLVFIILYYYVIYRLQQSLWLGLYYFVLLCHLQTTAVAMAWSLLCVLLYHLQTTAVAMAWSLLFCIIMSFTDYSSRYGLVIAGDGSTPGPTTKSKGRNPYCLQRSIAKY